VEIRKGVFDYGNEVDVKIDFEERCRIAIRKRGEYYEIYKAYFDYPEEEVLFRSKSLKEVVEFSNKKFNMDDWVRG
jgi:hypothetical protein